MDHTHSTFMYTKILAIRVLTHINTARPPGKYGRETAHCGALDRAAHLSRRLMATYKRVIGDI